MTNNKRRSERKIGSKKLLWYIYYIELSKIKVSLLNKMV
tara:strand:+ start:186 stop:302 length:117 start_codon:yes stop_codon:yes gene_type:complete